jgi:hypothetical protein
MFANKIAKFVHAGNDCPAGVLSIIIRSIIGNIEHLTIAMEDERLWRHQSLMGLKFQMRSSAMLLRRCKV